MRRARVAAAVVAASGLLVPALAVLPSSSLWPLTLARIGLAVLISVTILAAATGAPRLWVAPWLFCLIFLGCVLVPLVTRWLTSGSGAGLALLAATCLVIFSTGTLMARVAFPVPRTSFPAPYSTSWLDSWSGPEYVILSVVVLGLALAFAGPFLFGIGPGILDALRAVSVDSSGSSQAALANARLNVRPGNGSAIVWVIYVVPLLACAMVARGVALRRRRQLAVGLLLVVVGLAAMLVLTFRSYVLYFLLNLAVVIELALGGSNRVRRLPIYMAVMIVSLLMLDQVRGLNSDAALVHRAATIGDQLDFVINTFGATQSLAYGGTWLQDAGTLLPGHVSHLGFNGTVYHDMGYEGQGTATVTLIGELWANFGLVGTVVGFLAYGLLLGGIHQWFLRSVRSLDALLWYSTAAIVLSKACVAGIGENVFPAAVVLLPFLIVSSMLVRWRCRHSAFGHKARVAPPRVADASG